MLIDLLLSKAAFALPYQNDFTFFELGEVQTDFGAVVFLVVVVAAYFIFFPIRESIQKALVQKNLKQYQKKKALSKMQSMNASTLVVKGMVTIADDCGKLAEDLLADNEIFEACLVEFRDKYKGHPLLRTSQKMRIELGFTFGNPNAKFLTTKMLESMQEVRVFADMPGRHISFLSKVARSSDKQLWLVPPRVKGKYFDISKFDSLTIKVFRPFDGEFSFKTKLRSQVTRPYNALVCDQTSEIKRINPDQMHPVKIDFESKFVFMIEQVQELTIFKKYDSYPCMASVLALSTGSIEIASEHIPEEAHEGCYVLFKLKVAGLNEKITAKLYHLGQKKNVTYAKLQITKLSEKSRLSLEKFIKDQQRIKLH